MFILAIFIRFFYNKKKNIATSEHANHFIPYLFLFRSFRRKKNKNLAIKIVIFTNPSNQMSVFISNDNSKENSIKSFTSTQSLLQIRSTHSHP